MWGLLEGGHLFFAKKNGILDDEQHLAEMVSLLGPPPQEFLKRSEKCYQYWDSQGTTPKSLFFNSKKIALFCLGHFAIIICWCHYRRLERFRSDSWSIFRNPWAVASWGGPGSFRTVLAQNVMLDARGEARCGGAGFWRVFDAAIGHCLFGSIDRDSDVQNLSAVREVLWYARRKLRMVWGEKCCTEGEQ